jgi:hypothetical protein
MNEGIAPISPSTDHEMVHRSPPLGILAVVFVSLFLLSIAINFVMTNFAPYPVPYKPIEELQAYYTRYPNALRVVSFLQFGASIPLGLFAATIVSRLLFHRIRVAGVYIAVFGGIGASLFMAGKVQGSGHPILSGAARIGTGAAVVATEFAGQGSLNQPFSQADYLRNQMAAEVATEGNRLSNRLQQPKNIPIVQVGTNQPLRIFLLNALDIGSGRNQNLQPAASSTFANATTDQSTPSEESLVLAQTAYIQALEAQLADMRAALNGKQPNGQH